MHFHFTLNAVQILWTLTFAALLVLLTVLVGRERVRRFPWFTASIGLLTLRLLAERLIYGHMAPIPTSVLFFTLADLAVLLDLLVLAEIARRAFDGARRRPVVIASFAAIAVAVAVVGIWGPWPARRTVFAHSELAHVRLMQLLSEKGDIFAAVLAIELGILVVFLGRRFRAGWRSHPQGIAIGLSAAATSLLVTRAALQAIGAHTTIHSHAELEQALALQGRIANANSAIYFAVLIWWIAVLWLDEPESPDFAISGSERAQFRISA
ncbi:MAG TPA: hypothetical protein VF730_02655 [Terracidiphilus sp.]